MYSKKLLAIAGMAVLMVAGTAAWAESSTVSKTPGHIMQRTPEFEEHRTGSLRICTRSPEAEVGVRIRLATHPKS